MPDNGRGDPHDLHALSPQDRRRRQIRRQAPFFRDAATQRSAQRQLKKKAPPFFKARLIVFELTYVSEGADVGRFRAFASLAGHELNLLPFLECPKTIRKDVRMMNEEIFPAIIGCYEAIAFLVVEPLNGACTQTTVSFGSISGALLIPCFTQ